MRAIDETYMKMVIEEAKKGIGHTSPNPYVGALIVKNNKIIATGYHAQYGPAHAELDAITHATESLAGSTLYCNLEPCCHEAKQTPPCAQRIINEKIARVVIANRDPNFHVNGKGIDLLRAAGIEVTEGILQDEGEQLNEVFFTSMLHKKPFVHLKWAQSLDGNIATYAGNSKWISSPEALHKVHLLRKKYDAILIGQNTLVKDNPHLTARLDEHVSAPWRIILAKLNTLSMQCNVTTDAYNHKTICITDATDIAQNAEKAATLKANGVRIATVNRDETGALDLRQVLAELHAFGITSVLVEGGSAILTSFIEQNLWNRMSVFIAPLFIGGGLQAVKSPAPEYINNAARFRNIQYETYGDTIQRNIQNKGSLCLPD